MPKKLDRAMAAGELPIRKLMHLWKLNMFTIYGWMKENQVDKQEVLCQANCVIDEWIKGNELERYSLERLTGSTLLEMLLTPQLWWESSHRQNRSNWTWLCAKKTLFMDIGNWILYNYHVPQTIILVLIFFNLLKMWKPFWAHRLYKKKKKKATG